MFERFNEKARRAIFFARYEASVYGSRQIETEHLLLGLLRENLALRDLLRDTGADSEIRAEIERVIVRAERIPTSVEVPLSTDSKKVLDFAVEEARRLAHPHVAAEHLLLGILRADDCFAAQIIKARGVSASQVRETFGKTPLPATYRKPPLPLLEEFLNGLKWHTSDRLIPFFARNAQLVDVHGKRWNHEEITKNFEDIFAPYAKKNATFLSEETLVDSADSFAVTVLWKNALVASMERVWMHRMTILLVLHADDWSIVSVQVTPVQP